VKRVGLLLCRKLRGQIKLIPIILDLAECWMVSFAKRTDPDGALFDGSSPDMPYVTLKIAGQPSSPLRRLVFTTVSHDQGWSSHTAEIGTYRQVHSWFEAGNASLQPKNRRKIENNVHGSPDTRTHRNVWVPSLSSKYSDWMATFRSDDVLEVYAKAQYPGWENHVYSAEIVAY
ncbi:hypothetical protein B0H16DRAFT_1781882, partial [Mycena metata]